MKYGPNSEQVEAYLRQLAALGVDDWVSLAQELKDQATPSDAVDKAIQTGRSRARRNGLLSEVDAAARAAHLATDAVLDASADLTKIIDRTFTSTDPVDAPLAEALGEAGVAALRSVATSAASLLVLRPLLEDDGFSRAWPIPRIDPHDLPDHVYVPPLGAIG